MGGGGNLPVGPGIWGFLAFFVLAVALWFLVRNMNSRLRRMAYRDRDEQQAVNVAAGADSDATASDGRVDADGLSRPLSDDGTGAGAATQDDPRPDGQEPRP